MDANLASASVAIQLVLALALLVLAARSLARTRSSRLGWLVAAFALFAVQAGLLALALLTPALAVLDATAFGAAAGAAGLLCIYLGLLRP